MLSMSNTNNINHSININCSSNSNSGSDLLMSDNLLLTRPYSSCRVSPYHSNSNNNNNNPLVLSPAPDNQKRAWTAPTSPLHPRYTHRHRPYGNLTTPQSSPVYPEGGPTELPMIRDKSSFNSATAVAIQGIMLPSLRHLQLLPDPRIQEHSYLYPDTSERTPIWRDTLINWCKNENYHDYLSIKTSKQMVNDLEEKKNVDDVVVPSILKCKDPFYGLSNRPWEFQSPVTPPMSPKRVVNQPLNMENNKIDNETTSLSSTTITTVKKSSPQTVKFTPIISEKLIQCVKKQYKELNTEGTKKNLIKPASITKKVNTHKKTNSFKALQIKQMLMNRDVLSSTSKTDGNQTRRRNNNRRSSEITTTTTPKANIGSTMTFPALLSSATLTPVEQTTTSKRSRSMSPTRRRNSNGKDIRTSNSKSRSRSRSPVRIIHHSLSMGARTPPSQTLGGANSNTASNITANVTMSLPRYHKFPVGDNNSNSNNNVNNNLPSNNQQINGTTMYTDNKHNTMARSSYSAPTSSSTSPRGSRKTHHPHHHQHAVRKCVSCDSQDSPCWRPSWSPRRQDQLCNSCGLRYKKTRTRCLNMQCKKIPTKGELNIMKSQGKIRGTVANNPTLAGATVVGYRCLFCDSITETMDLL